MARRGENIYKRKDGRWEGRYKNGLQSDGKTRYSSVYGIWQKLFRGKDSSYCQARRAKVRLFKMQFCIQRTITPPKSKTSAREIPIPDVLYSYLEKMRSDNDNYILTGEKIFAEPRTIQYRFKSILKNLGLPQVNFHALRHMFATKCVDVGVDVKTLSEILGHCSVELTLNRYVHSSVERKRSCMKLFSDTVFAV